MFVLWNLAVPWVEFWLAAKSENGIVVVKTRREILSDLSSECRISGHSPVFQSRPAAQVWAARSSGA